MAVLPYSDQDFANWVRQTLAQSSGALAGPQSYTNEDIYGGMGLRPAAFSSGWGGVRPPSMPTPAADNGPAGYINPDKHPARLEAGLPGMPLNAPRVPVPSYDQMASAFADARQPLKLNVAGGHQQAWGFGAGIPQLPADTPAVKATASLAGVPMKQPGQMQSYEAGGYVYVPDGKGGYQNMGRAKAGDGKTIYDGFIKNAVQGAGFNYGGPMSGADNAMAQGALPPIPKPPVNRTGFTPDGTEYVNGVKTGRIGGPFAETSTQNRQTATTAMMAEMARLQSANPGAALSRSGLEALFADPNNGGTTKDELAQNAALRAVDYNGMSKGQQAAFNAADGERQRMAQITAPQRTRR